jgi:hypothetical protein
MRGQCPPTPRDVVAQGGRVVHTRRVKDTPVRVRRIFAMQRRGQWCASNGARWKRRPGPEKTALRSRPATPRLCPSSRLHLLLTPNPFQTKCSAPAAAASPVTTWDGESAPCARRQRKKSAAAERGAGSNHLLCRAKTLPAVAYFALVAVYYTEDEATGAGHRRAVDAPHEH